MGARRKLIHGVGINDADYEVVDGKGGKQNWVCPYYKRWRDVLKRCYSKAFHRKNKSYINVDICREWIYFSEFKKWMETQDWKGMALDKDFLGDGSLYSPDTCLFLTQEVNSLLTLKQSKKNDLPMGVTWYEDKQIFMAYGSDKNKTVYLGRYDTPLGANIAWMEHKKSVCERVLSESVREDDIIALKTFIEILNDHLSEGKMLWARKH